MNAQLIETTAELFIDIAARGTVLLLLACLAAWMLRRSSAALRHSIWSLTLLCLILLPFVLWAVPQWRVPVLPAEAIPKRGTAPSTVPSPSEPVAEPLPAEIPATPRTISLVEDSSKVVRTTIPPVSSPQPTATNETEAASEMPIVGERPIAVWSLFGWLTGAMIFGLVLASRLVRVRRFRQQSRPNPDELWLRLFAELTQRLRRSVELREHSQPIVPMTCGILRPAVLVPEASRQWDDSMKRSVLLHELAHVRRSDVAWLLVGRMACTLFWFHPLAWFALRRLRHEGELACDDAVVQSGERATDYAEQLLNVARICSAARGVSLGAAMAEGSSLEHRVRSLFDSSRNHRPVRGPVLVGLMAVFAMALPMIAAVHPVSQAAHAEVTPGVTTAVSTTVPGASTATPKKYVPKWSRGGEALERIVQLKPLFGKEVNGLKLGIAWPTPQRVFKLGDRLPVELFLMNVSQRDVSTQFVLNFMAYPPHVEDSRGRRIDIPRLITFMARPIHKLTLKPGEACGIPVRGLAVGADYPAMSFKSPPEGSYRMTYRLAGVESGPIGFDVVEEKSGELGVRAHYTESAGMASPERMSILKPVFGKAARGIEMGLAFGTTRTTFGPDENVPVEVVLRNAGSELVSFKFDPDFMPYPPGIVGPDGKLIAIMPLMHWMFIPPLDLTLKPGEAHAVTTPGLRTSDDPCPLNFVAKTPGRYRVTLSRAIWHGKESVEWSEMLTAGELAFEVLRKAEGKPRIRIAGKEPQKEKAVSAPASRSGDAEKPKEEAKPANRKTSSIPLKEVIWWEKVNGLQAGFLLTSPARPNQRVPKNSTATYRIIVRNTTKKLAHFIARLLPIEHRDAPYVIPSDDIATAFDNGAPPKKFRATGGQLGQKADPAYVIRLAPGEAAFVPGMSGGNDIRLYFGEGDSGGSPSAPKVLPGMNWIVQPLQIREFSPERSRVALEGRFELTKIDADGRPRQVPAERTVGAAGGKTLYPRIQLAVGTLDATAVQNSKKAIWGKVDKGLQCGIRLLKPKKKTYRVGDSLEAELLWRNVSEKSIWSPMPRKLDLYPLVHDSEGKFKLIDFGARFNILPISHEFKPGEVRSLGTFTIELVAEGTPSPKSNAEPAHLTLAPGEYVLSGSGGVSAPGGGSPRSGEIQFAVGRASE